MQSTGAYSADRASALSGVPKSTIHYWARTELLVPSVSIEKVKLWSYPDLMGLRTIYWLRQHKTDDAGAKVLPTSMRSPHVVHTRLETSALYALDRDGLGVHAILALYPYLAQEQLDEALDLERQLAANLAIPDAA